MDTNDDTKQVEPTSVRLATVLRIGLRGYECRSGDEVWLIFQAWIELRVELTTEEIDDTMWGIEP